MSIERCCHLMLAVCCLLAPALPAFAADSTSPARQKLSLTAALVLSPEFCSTVNKKGHETFPVGKAACTELEPALKDVFNDLSTVDDSSKAGSAQVVLQPRFADVGATQRAFAFSDRELVVLVEWTVRDQSGKVLWLETVQGSAKRHIGNVYTHHSNLKHIVTDSVRDMARQSAIRMSSSPQLLALSAQPVK